jgi:hypothetical protein
MDVDVHVLEEHLIAELRMFRSLFGSRNQQQEHWAVQSMPAELVPHYMHGWKESRRRAWKYLQRVAARIREASGDDATAWSVRLHGLELLAGLDVPALQPTTQQGL